MFEAFESPLIEATKRNPNILLVLPLFIKHTLILFVCVEQCFSTGVPRMAARRSAKTDRNLL